MADKDALALIFARNAFYRRIYLLALGAFALSLLAILFLIFVIIFLTRNPSHPLYFATDNVSRLIQIIPKARANMSTEEMLNWAEDAVEAAYTYDYLNYPGQLQSAQKYFTTYGWKQYMRALSASNNLVALKERKMIINAKVVQKPKVLTQGILSGAFAWRVEMPVLVTYLLPPYDGSKKFSNALKVTMIVQRQPALQGYKGLGILQMIATFESSSSSQPNQLSNLPSA